MLAPSIRAARDRLAPFRAVPGRHRGDAQRSPVARTLQVGLLPGGQAPDLAGGYVAGRDEAVRSAARSERKRDPLQVGAAAAVQVVGVLVVREQHGVNRAKVLGARGGWRQLGERRAVRPWMAARRVEGRVSDQPQPPDVKDGGRPANDPDTHRHGSFLSWMILIFSIRLTVSIIMEKFKS